jgi:hypothetical protein
MGGLLSKVRSLPSMSCYDWLVDVYLCASRGACNSRGPKCRSPLLLDWTLGVLPPLENVTFDEVLLDSGYVVQQCFETMSFTDCF